MTAATLSDRVQTLLLAAHNANDLGDPACRLAVANCGDVAADVRALEARAERMAGALKEIRDLAADRKAFVLEGPRVFQRAVTIIDAALAPAAEKAPDYLAILDARHLESHGVAAEKAQEKTSACMDCGRPFPAGTGSICRECGNRRWERDVLHRAPSSAAAGPEGVILHCPGCIHGAHGGRECELCGCRGYAVEEPKPADALTAEAQASGATATLDVPAIAERAAALAKAASDAAEAGGKFSLHVPADPKRDLDLLACQVGRHDVPNLIAALTIFAADRDRLRAELARAVEERDAMRAGRDGLLAERDALREDVAREIGLRDAEGSDYSERLVKVTEERDAARSKLAEQMALAAEINDAVVANELALAKERDAALAKLAALEAEAVRMKALLNAPEVHDFALGVKLEAAHQRERWPSEHDAGKTDADWFWLIGYLAGKALHNPGEDPKGEKRLHRVVTIGAAAANWHAALLGKTNMRPGIETPPEAVDRQGGKPEAERPRCAACLCTHPRRFGGPACLCDHRENHPYVAPEPTP